MSIPDFSTTLNISGTPTDLIFYKVSDEGEMYYRIDCGELGTFDMHLDNDTCMFKFGKGEIPYDIRDAEAEISRSIEFHDNMDGLI